ncbi:MAG: glycosyltransferase [Candidatus Latescibacteria bacterium]|nr:glycosyltransferase [Candidatus Latescibacterota bacterium]
MVDWLNGLLVITGGLYITALLWLWTGLRAGWGQLCNEQPTVSVVVAARNEAEAIGDCLDALMQQRYGGMLEIMIVDDRSSDATAQVVRGYQGQGPHPLRLLRAPDTLQYRCPKKSALACGIAASNGQLLLFTDADCQPPPDWVQSTVAQFGSEVGLVAGYSVPMRGRGWLQGVLELDNVAVAALGAGSMGRGRPLSCTGRNLAYRRTLYDQLGGFASIGHLVGGDDVYFMRLVQARTSWWQIFNSNGPAVPCKPVPIHWAAAVQQKLRHASKAGHYRGPAMLLAVAVYLFHAGLLIGLAEMALSGRWNGWLMGVWGARWGVDLIFLGRFMRGRGQWSLLRFWPLLEILYIPYVLLFTAIGRLGWFRWK